MQILEWLQQIFWVSEYLEIYNMQITKNIYSQVVDNAMKIKIYCKS